MFSSFRFRFVFRSDLLATMILFLFFDISSNFLSSSVRGSLLFNTSNTKSACCKACFDFSTPIFSTISSVSLIPAVSIRFKVIPFRLRWASTISLVVPGMFVTIAFSSSISLFRILLFPTFGLPIIATFIPDVKSLLVFEFSIILFKSLSMVSISFSIVFVVISSMSWYSG